MRASGLAEATLLELWAGAKPSSCAHTEGSAIRRIGYERWQRNLAVALGNALRATRRCRRSRDALQARRERASALVREHIDWALAQAYC